ncbi:ATP-binding protein [Verrucosispora sp. WMMD573]|uniref:ATP-binding protein n=1 Tax=Verrucosispora sp. WMMD573 TaxID=3015149 RepID=UPI00248C46C3|nr:ATP-binding protein [Verrucosispora sp. WMMD573]WBB57225.1 ATP-binding protein [Verrucosispora sp. WMMD573]
MMTEEERRALAALRFNWAPTPDDVWKPTPFHVDGLHHDVVATVLDSFAEADHSADSSPVGVAVLGQRGTGKTHLLGTVRQQVQQRNGFFFLVELLEARAFWHSTAMSMLAGFARPMPDGATQLRTFLRRLADQMDAPRTVRRAVTGETELSRPALDAFVDLIRKTNRQIGTECQDTARALVLYAAEQPALQDIGYYFLCSNDEEEPGLRAGWGLRRSRRAPQEVVKDTSRLLAMVGPTVIAVDQIDLMVAQSVKTTHKDVRGEVDWQTSLLLEQVASGLMALRETTRRSLSVVSCLPQTWQDVKEQATDTVQDRFREAAFLKEIPSVEVGRELVEKRFAVLFDGLGFSPPYPTWPIHPSAFDEVVGFTPRELLRRIDTHVRACLAAGEVRELRHLLLSAVGQRAPAVEATPVRPATAASLADEYGKIDARYAELIAAADPEPAVHQQSEDARVPELLKAGLTAWIAEQGSAVEAFSLDPIPAGGKPALHARLRHSLDDESEDEEHWSFRAICAPHHIAALNRIRNAITTAGLTEGVAKRRLFLLRSDDWSAGARTREVLDAFERAGGRTLGFPAADISRLAALEQLIQTYGLETLRPWFAERRPAADIGCLRDALGSRHQASEGAAHRVVGRASVSTPPAVHPPPAVRPVTDLPRPDDVPVIGSAAGPPAAGVDPQHLVLGTVTGRPDPVRVGLESLRRHTVIFAGSGSGKTVLIRRLVEECALRGVSAIVLDPNNDLARLGEAWPATPDGWGSDDADLADAYLSGTDVVIWTPGRQAGRPLSFQPLPRFADVLDDPDGFTAAVNAAVATLAPHARVDGGTDKARLGRAVLREALIGYAHTGGNDLPEFTELLNELPDGMSQLDGAPKLAASMAQLLKAALINDPLFGGAGTPVDPGELLTPPPGRRARISVISFVGLPDDHQRQSFVNQLQLALFTWIKRHPAGDRPLGGLFVMDEAQTLAPSGTVTACTQSTLALTSQARKYGLGLVFATQSPKALHNQIPGNAATQLFGLLTAPVQIEAARDVARAKGADVPDVGKMRTGQFYAAVEGSRFVKMQAPMCLSHHPRSPLTSEEVVRRAARQ